MTAPPPEDTEEREEGIAERSQRTGECICTATERMRGRPFPECGAHRPLSSPPPAGGVAAAPESKRLRQQRREALAQRLASERLGVAAVVYTTEEGHQRWLREADRHLAGVAAAAPADEATEAARKRVTRWGIYLQPSMTDEFLRDVAALAVRAVQSAQPQPATADRETLREAVARLIREYNTRRPSWSVAEFANELLALLDGHRG